MQPIVFDKRRVLRFKENKIVSALLDFSSSKGMSLNEIAVMPFRREDREQLAQLIGYSVSGFGDLSYARRTVIAKADRIAESKRKGRGRG
jgi:hypothetical protein